MAIQLKRSLSSVIDLNYKLEQGQIGIEMPAASNTSANPFRVKIGDGSTVWSSLPYFGETDVSKLVPNTRTINNKALNADINLTATDVGAATAGHVHDNYVPTSRKINNKNLASDITLSASDVSARPNTWNPALTDCSGVLTVAKGGTGVTSLDSLKTALGIGDSSGSSGGWNYSKSGTYGYFRPADTTTKYYEIEAYYLSLTSTNNSIGMLASNSTATERGGVAVWHDSGSAFAFGPSNTTNISCGGPYQLWTKIYANSGTIQTSDRSAKHAIHYLSDSSVSTVDENGTQKPAIELKDVIEFIQSCEPATFIYNASEDSKDDPEYRQLGLIADDVESTKLFPYIGCRMTWEAHPDQNIEAGTSLALKPLPIAIAAITACKYLLQRLETFEAQLS